MLCIAGQIWIRNTFQHVYLNLMKANIDYKCKWVLLLFIKWNSDRHANTDAKPWNVHDMQKPLNHLENQCTTELFVGPVMVWMISFRMVYASVSLAHNYIHKMKLQWTATINNWHLEINGRNSPHQIAYHSLHVVCVNNEKRVVCSL